MASGPDTQRVVFTDPSGLGLKGAGGAIGTPTQSIVPFLIADVTPGNGTYGTTFLSYTTATGLYPLTDAEYDTLLVPAVPLAGRNVAVTGSQRPRARSRSTRCASPARRLRSTTG